MNANMLGAQVLNTIGLTTNPYFNYLNTYSKISPHINPNKNDSYYDDFELLQYDIVHGNQYFYDLIGIPKSNEDYTIGNPIKINDVIISYKFKNDYVVDIIGEGFGWMSSIDLNSEEIQTIGNTGTRITFKTSQEALSSQDKNKIRVKQIDSRGKIIKESEDYLINDLKTLEKKRKKSPDSKWQKVKLYNEKLEWEFFDEDDSFYTIRVDLDLEEKTYFVKNNKKILDDQNAETIDRIDQSDIYSNGYLYLSVPKKKSGWKNPITNKMIQSLLMENDYNLYLYKE